jgi:hypothetical protein
LERSPESRDPRAAEGATVRANPLPHDTVASMWPVLPSVKVTIMEESLRKALLIGVCGFTGASTRLAMSDSVDPPVPSAVFPTRSPVSHTVGFPVLGKTGGLATIETVHTRSPFSPEEDPT